MRNRALPSEPSAIARDARSRALMSEGASNEDVYRMIAASLRARHQSSGTLLDVGCGSGRLRPFVQPFCDRYVGADLVRYDSFPDDCEFYSINFDSGKMPLADAFADVVVAAEIIEHLENPRGLMRELARLVKFGGLIIVTTPNQLCLLSILTLITRRRFLFFQDVHYPAHLTALLEVDLLRMASEVGLVGVTVEYSHRSRIPKTPWHYPGIVSRLLPRALSENVLLAGRKG